MRTLPFKANWHLCRHFQNLKESQEHGNSLPHAQLPEITTVISEVPEKLQKWQQLIHNSRVMDVNK